MRQQVVRPLANGLFMFTDVDDSNQLLYPTKVVNALEAAHQADLLRYKSENIDAQDKVNELTEKLELAHGSIKNMTDKCVEYRQQLESMEGAVADAAHHEGALAKLEKSLDEAFGALGQAQGRVTELEWELRKERKHAKQLATRLSHAGPRRVERSKPTRRPATRA